ncbi:MAG: hypothetical protein MUF69_04075 [Desulfobacterota bacterium]|jgi:hypothetical protein|nr:hypothetical protein [Thermodesulfobacteriota bacterium]
MGGRFGKYGDHKRRENLKKGRRGAQALEKIKGKTGKSLPRPARQGPQAVKTGPGAP